MPGRRRGRIAAIAAGIIGLSIWLAALWWGIRSPAFLENWPVANLGFEPWQPLSPGIDYARAAFTSPRPYKCHAVRIDLTDPRIAVGVPRGPHDGNNMATAQLPTSWLRRHHLTLAINATPFFPYQILPGTRTRLQGLSISAGEQWAEPVPNLDAFVLRPDGRPDLVAAQADLGRVTEGVGGFLIVLRHGQPTHEEIEADAAVFIGYSADAHWLYCLVVDGGQPGYSEGVMPSEGALLMQQLGASDALRMDGGGSATLVAAGGWTGARLLNRPRSPGYAGICRPIGNVLGVRLRSTPR